MTISVEHKRWKKIHAVSSYGVGYSYCGIKLRVYVYEIASDKQITCSNCLRIINRSKKYALQSL